MPSPSLVFDVPPYRLSGVVVGPLLNHAAALAALGDAVREAPYKAAPKGPILYIKPRNTLATAGAAVTIPSTCEELEIGASLGLVIGRTACRVDAGRALEHVCGYTLVADLSIPHDSFYRPVDPLQGARRLVPGRPAGRRARSRSPMPMRWRSGSRSTASRRRPPAPRGMVRSAARLIADVSEFMTLRPGRRPDARRGLRRAARPRRPELRASTPRASAGSTAAWWPKATEGPA